MLGTVTIEAGGFNRADHRDGDHGERLLNRAPECFARVLVDGEGQTGRARAFDKTRFRFFPKGYKCSNEVKG
jgi:hypothetical protein